MRRRGLRSTTRGLPEVAYLLLGHVGAHAEVHGYRLGRLLATSPLGLPSLHLGQVYRILHDLAARGLVRSRIETDRSRPARQLFAITRAGEVAFRRWLGGPARGSLPVRDQLLHRLRFGNQIPPASLRRLLRDAVRECEADLTDLRSAAGQTNGANGANGSTGDGRALLSMALEHRLAADRRWLAEATRFVDASGADAPSALDVPLAGAAATTARAAGTSAGPQTWMPRGRGIAPRAAS
jgi:DNA-binding PadR family transcriptional regulator